MENTAPMQYNTVIPSTSVIAGSPFDGTTAWLQNEPTLMLYEDDNTASASQLDASTNR